MLIFSLITTIVVITIYVLQAKFLNKLNLLIYKKKTALAWIPICNIYLLGKLALGKIMGWILIILIFLTANYTVTVNNYTRTYTIFPTPVVKIIQLIYEILIIVLFIYDIVKYNKLKNQPPEEQEKEQDEEQEKEKDEDTII